MSHSLVLDSLSITARFSFRAHEKSSCLRACTTREISIKASPKRNPPAPDFPKRHTRQRHFADVKRATTYVRLLLTFRWRSYTRPAQIIRVNLPFRVSTNNVASGITTYIGRPRCVYTAIPRKSPLLTVSRLPSRAQSYSCIVRVLYD